MRDLKASSLMTYEKKNAAIDRKRWGYFQFPNVARTPLKWEI